MINIIHIPTSKSVLSSGKFECTHEYATYKEMSFNYVSLAGEETHHYTGLFCSECEEVISV